MAINLSDTITQIRGPRGVAGATGDQGPVGNTGLRGNTGATGATGPRGNDATSAPKGAIGDKGGVGDKGANGATGNMGRAGIQTSTIVLLTTNYGTGTYTNYKIDPYAQPVFTMPLTAASSSQSPRLSIVPGYSKQTIRAIWYRGPTDVVYENIPMTISANITGSGFALNLNIRCAINWSSRSDWTSAYFDTPVQLCVIEFARTDYFGS